MVALNKSIIDDIIKNWFPIVGVLFVVAGMSYLFYEGVWQRLNEHGRLTIGFLTGVALISGSYHKHDEARHLIEQAGHSLEFLPPYSPDLNPIEHKWAQAKALRRKQNCSIDALFSQLF